MRCFMFTYDGCGGDVEPAGGARDNWTRDPNKPVTGLCAEHRKGQFTSARWDMPRNKRTHNREEG